jgi:hypothetical protein
MSTEELSNELRAPPRPTINANQRVKSGYAFAGRIDIEYQPTSQVYDCDSQQGRHPMSTKKPSGESSLLARLPLNVKPLN